MTVIAYDHENLPVTDYHAEGLYEEFVNLICEPVKIGALEYDAGRVLREVDPIAFRTGMLEYVDDLIAEGTWTEA